MRVRGQRWGLGLAQNIVIIIFKGAGKQRTKTQGLRLRQRKTKADTRDLGPRNCNISFRKEEMAGVCVCVCVCVFSPLNAVS